MHFCCSLGWCYLCRYESARDVATCSPSLLVIGKGSLVVTLKQKPNQEASSSFRSECVSDVLATADTTRLSGGRLWPQTGSAMSSVSACYENYREDTFCSASIRFMERDGWTEGESFVQKDYLSSYSIRNAYVYRNARCMGAGWHLIILRCTNMSQVPKTQRRAPVALSVVHINIWQVQDSGRPVNKPWCVTVEKTGSTTGIKPVWWRQLIMWARPGRFFFILFC